MSEGARSSEARLLLRRLAANDELSARLVLAPRPELAAGNGPSTNLLDRRISALVRLAALLVVGASTESLRWALDTAQASGVDDEAILAALAVAGCIAGTAQLVESARRLALAMGAR